MNLMEAKRVKIGDRIYHASIYKTIAVVSGPVEIEGNGPTTKWIIPVSGVETSMKIGNKFYISGKLAFNWTLKKPDFYSRYGQEGLSL